MPRRPGHQSPARPDRPCSRRGWQHLVRAPGAPHSGSRPQPPSPRLRLPPKEPRRLPRRLPSPLPFGPARLHLPAATSLVPSGRQTLLAPGGRPALQKEEEGLDGPQGRGARCLSFQQRRLRLLVLGERRSRLETVVIDPPAHFASMPAEVDSSPELSALVEIRCARCAAGRHGLTRSRSRGRGGAFFVLPRSPFLSSTGPRGSRCAAIAPRRGRGPCPRLADRSSPPRVPGLCAAPRPGTVPRLAGRSSPLGVPDLCARAGLLEPLT